MSTTEDQLIVEEYKSLQSEIRSSVDESVRLEIYAVGAIGGFYSWFLAQERLPIILSLIPVSLALFGLWRSKALLRRVEHISTYIRKNIEVNRSIRWETHFNETRAESEITPNVKKFWWTLVVLTSVFALFFFFRWFCEHCCFGCWHDPI